MAARVRGSAHDLPRIAREGFGFAHCLPMQGTEQVPRLVSGVPNVFRVIELKPKFLIRLRQAAISAASVGLCFVLYAAPASAQSEDQIKAAFLYNFARYVEWPASAFASGNDAVRICMVGSGDFASVVSKTVSGKTLSCWVREMVQPDPSSCLSFRTMIA